MKIKQLKLWLSIPFILTLFTGYAQEGIYSHFMYNTQNYNPASVGLDNSTTVMGIQRLSMIGFEGAPMLTNLMLNASVLNDNAGAGLSLVHDNIGATRSLYYYGDLAYKLKINNSYTFAFGMKVGFSQMTSNLASLRSNTGDDPSANVSTSLRPNVGSGFKFKGRGFTIGFAVPKILEHQETLEIRHYYLTASYNKRLNSVVGLRTNFLLRATEATSAQTEWSALVYFLDQIWVGPAIRHGEAISLHTGIQVLEALDIGYAFEYGVSGTKTTSHEFMVRFNLNKNKAVEDVYGMGLKETISTTLNKNSKKNKKRKIKK